MIVCICTGASDRDVSEVIDDGARCLCDFRSRGIGTSCGSCHDTLKILMLARGVAVRELCFEEAIIARIAERCFEPNQAGDSCPTAPMPPPLQAAAVLDRR